MSRLPEYKRLMAQLLLIRRETGSDEEEERILDAMDHVWRDLNDQEREAVNELARRLASGELSEDVFVANEKEYPMEGEPSSTFPVHVEVDPAPWPQTLSSAAVGTSPLEKTKFIEVVPILQSATFHLSMTAAEGSAQ